MSNDETAVPRLVAIDRRQLFLRTVDVEKLASGDRREVSFTLKVRGHYQSNESCETNIRKRSICPQFQPVFRQCFLQPLSSWLLRVTAPSWPVLRGQDNRRRTYRRLARHPRLFRHWSQRLPSPKFRRPH